MTETLDRTESIFVAAVALATAAERAEYLDHACAGDAALRGHVEALLRAHERAGHLLDRPVPGGPQQTAAYLPNEQPGTMIASRYKLLEAIGEGGMGSVWVAEQTQPVRRKVALKLIKPGMDSRSVLARFEAERQALAVMDHPNIAKVLDGGLTDTGRPFFVMEYVKGVPITEYCDATRLSVPERLRLFVQVCQAVQHAPPEGNHPPRPEAVQHSRCPLRRQAGAQGHRLRPGQGDAPAADRARHCTPPTKRCWARRFTCHPSRRNSTTSTWTRVRTSIRWACCFTNY